MIPAESTLDAALLLANFANQASKEDKKCCLNNNESIQHQTMTSDSKSCISDLTEDAWEHSQSFGRARAVSLCSQDPPINSPFLQGSMVSPCLSSMGRPLTLPNSLSISEIPAQAGSILPPQSIAVLSLSHMDWSKLIPPISPLASPQVSKKLTPFLNLGYSAQSLSSTAKNLCPRGNYDRAPKTKPVKAVLRKKFSWRDYPELEDCLIANREEYLKHSTMNYTHEQRTFNNRLTQKLLDIAKEHGYIFEDFSFVMVRDRIRCYYKSYIQSLKKKGCIVGYSARKAGLI